ncbi:hypothetical protein Tsubulata_026904 [Turnera subulata]|uniref:RING-type E3 ubiquitin transferase n=1 Tax=Turnera subulata TaxID=218843 RepID=A0A9Q0JEA7_9ROSI|nr:hypothetical protein Tsubulata_026904 [Turnera subulata]
MRLESGLKKEVREMLPIIVYKESFSVRDTQCPVCLSDYQPEDRLQQIPGCGHTFHMECIDSWLSNHATCPICRLSLLPSAKIRGKSVDNRREDIQESSEAGHSGETSARLESSEGSQHTSVVQLRNEESGTVQSNTEGEAKSSISADQLRESVNLFKALRY